MRKRIFLLVVCGIVFSNPVLGRHDESWKQYPYQAPKSLIQFPKDEGAHPYTSFLEWWYVVMHVQGQITGDEYAILVTHFNNRFRFFTISNLTQKTHKTGTAFGKLRSKRGYLDLKHETSAGVDWMRSKRDKSGNLIPFEYEFETHHSEMHLNTELRALKKPLMVGGAGLVEIGASGPSWYYSLTRLEAQGELTYGEVREPFKGIAWMDHQWGPFLISPVELVRLFETYEWFCIQLDDGRDFMVSNIYDRLYNLPQNLFYGGITMVEADGTALNVVKKEFTRTRYWRDPKTGLYSSMGWQLNVPQWDMRLSMTPDMENQMVHFPFNGSFWEGSASVTGSIEGVPVNGKAFGELMHHFQIPKLVLGPIAGKYRSGDPVRLFWQVLNPDAGNPLTYDVVLVGGGQRVELAKNLQKNGFTYDLKSLIPLSQRYHFEVTAHSVDGVISARKQTRQFTVIAQ